MIDKTKFRTPQGNLVMSSLFVEYQGDQEHAIYCLKPYDFTDHKGKFFPSLYLKYLEMEDVTEYDFANAYLEGIEHWDRLCQTAFFKPHVTKWRKHLELKLRAKALARVKQVAENEDSKEHLQANKYLLDKGYVPKKQASSKLTKAQIKEAADKEVLDGDRIEEDFERILGTTDYNEERPN